MTTGIEGDAIRRGEIVAITTISLVAGALAGLVTAVFRVLLAHADGWRDALARGLQGHGALGLLALVGAIGGATAFAAFLVRRVAPTTAGSGIPRVEATLQVERVPKRLFREIVVKFVGGLLAIGGGLALGREGPSVQIGADLSAMCGRALRRPASECRVLFAAGAGAGLATAFNSPIAGAIFVLEELVRRFETRIAIAALGASAGAISVARLILGDGPDFVVPPQGYAPLSALAAYLVLGFAAGLAGSAYCAGIVRSLFLARSWTRLPVELRAGAVGAIVALLAWFDPSLVGGGDALTQRVLDGTDGIWLVAGVFLLRFALGPVSYAAGTPGGLFAPMLVLGAQLGAMVAALSAVVHLDVGPDPTALAVVGMAAFFTAVVRAPLTGIILVIELTGCFALLLPMLVACLGAMAVPALLRTLPVYDSLREDPPAP